MIPTLIIVVIILLTALYVAAEFGVVSVRRSRLKLLADGGNQFAKALVPLVESPKAVDQFIAAAQIGITVCSLVLGAYGQAELSPLLVPIFARMGDYDELAALSASTAIVLVSLTTLQMVLGELVPKSVALRYPTKTAMYTAIPVQWSMRVFSWFILILNGSGLLLMRAMGVRQVSDHHQMHTAEDIEHMLGEAGSIDDSAHVRMMRALGLSIRPIRQLMIPRREIVGLPVELTIEEAAERIAENPYTRLPVYRGSIDDIVGILHMKDLVRQVVSGEESGGIEDLLRPVVHVPESLTAEQLFAEMRSQGTHQAIVVDEFGGIEGLVTLEDLVGDMLGQLDDEFKLAEVGPESLAGGKVRLAGGLRLYEVETVVGRRWVADADTVGGYVTELLGHLPEAGETVDVPGGRLEVEEMDGLAVGQVVFTPVPEVGEEEN